MNSAGPAALARAENAAAFHADRLLYDRARQRPMPQKRRGSVLCLLLEKKQRTEGAHIAAVRLDDRMTCAGA
jgi:hypothetical protein